MNDISSTETANRLLSKGTFKMDGVVLKLMLDYQMQLQHIMKDCMIEAQRKGAESSQQERFIKEVFYASELFHMITLATLSVNMDGDPLQRKVVESFAVPLLAGFYQAFCQALTGHVKSVEELDETLTKARTKALAFAAMQGLRDMGERR